MATIQGIEIELDGEVVPATEIVELGELTLTKEFANVAEYTTDITFGGDTARFIKEYLLEPPNGRIRRIYIDIFDTCCGGRKMTFRGYIGGDAIDWCERDCEVSVTPIGWDRTAIQRRCVMDTLIYETDRIKENKHIQVGYCTELRPNWLHDVFIIFGLMWTIAVFFLFIPLMPIITFVSAIIAVIKVISGKGVKEAVSTFKDGMTILFDLVKALRLLMIPCERRHPSPYIRDYIIGVCEKCGITGGFKSSIFNNPSSPYYDTVLLNAEIEKGSKKDIPKGLLDGNQPIELCAELLDKLADTFDAIWIVRNNQLEFERWDYFRQTSAIQPPTPQNDYNIPAKICYNYKSDPPNSNFLLQFESDSVDTVANESKFEWYYTRKEWNPDNMYPTTSGTWEVNVPFGMHRQRGDGIERDVLDFWNPLLNAVFVGVNTNKYKQHLLMEKGYGMTRRLLVVNKKGIIKDYNKPYHANELYDNFWFLRDIKNNPPRFDVTVESEPIDCSEWEFYIESLGKLMTVEFGNMWIQKIEVDFIGRTIKFTGEL